MALTDISQSLEDYLEAIFLISLEKGVARVKEVAQMLDVKKPSVVSAVKVLEKLGLVVHEHYGYLELTEEGKEKAREIYRRHTILFRFFHGILGVDEKTAEEDACRIEHHISKKSLARLVKLIEVLEENEELYLKRLEELLQEEKKMEKKEIKEKKLSQLKVGDRGRIKRILGNPSLKRRILNMGGVPGTEVKVEKVAPLGDPMDIVLRGYHLSLRREEAEKIVVEVD